MNLKEKLVLLNKYNITPDELLFIKMILLYQNEEDVELTNLYFSLGEGSRGSIFDMLTWLQAKGIVTKEYTIPKKGSRFDPNLITFNKNVIKNIYKASFDLGKDLFDEYPISTIVNGIEYRLKRISKKFDSLEDAFRAYGKYINWSEKKHKEVMELIQWGKDHNYSFTTLGDFIVDNDWENIKAIRDNGSYNSDIIRTV